MTWASVFQHTYNNTSILLLFIEFQMKTNSSFLPWLLMQWNKQVINTQPWFELKFLFVQISLKKSGILFSPPPKTHGYMDRLCALGTGRNQSCEVPDGTLVRGQEKQKLNCFACWTSEHFWNKLWFSLLPGKPKLITRWYFSFFFLFFFFPFFSFYKFFFLIYGGKNSLPLLAVLGIQT